MARLLFQKEDPWFDELKIVSTYSEKELERMILEHVDTVFPKYFTIPFNKTLTVAGIQKGRIPDLAIISKDYLEWWIVEVETYEDNLKHIQAQIQVFTLYDYNNHEIAKYMHSKNDKDLDLDKLIVMVQNVKPKVLVMVDEIDDTWKFEIEKLGAITCVFQVYKNKDGSHAFRLNGDYPKIFETTSHCRFIKYPPHTLEVDTPQWLKEGLLKIIKPKSHIFKKRNRRQRHIPSTPKTIEGLIIEIDFNGKISNWQVLLDDDKLYLKSIGFNYMSVINTYKIHADQNFKLYLKHN